MRQSNTNLQTPTEFILILTISLLVSSADDRSKFINCLKNCLKGNCHYHIDSACQMWCSTTKGGGDFSGEINFEGFLFLFVCLFFRWIKSFFLSLKMTLHTKLIKAFKFYNQKRIQNSYCFLNTIIFWIFSSTISKKVHSCKVIQTSINKPCNSLYWFSGSWVSLFDFGENSFKFQFLYANKL